MNPDGDAELSAKVSAKEEALERRLTELGPVVVAFSGGVDSTYLLAKAADVWGGRTLALTARSPSLPEAELEAARRLARSLGVGHRVLETNELARPGYTANGRDRCYHCKAELFDAATLAVEPGAVVADGFNADDFKDHRPGHQAALERNVVHPLADAQLTKAEIRALSRRRGLPTWDKPQMACLASRVPYGMEVTAERLARVESVERTLRRLNFADVRARLVEDRDDWVRIEVGVSEMTRLVEPGVREDVVGACHQAGFRFVTLDLEGFRSGRMNEASLVPLRRSRPSGAPRGSNIEPR